MNVFTCVAHFDAKGRIEEYIQRILPSTMDWTIIRMSFYFNNFITANKPLPGSDGTRLVAIPMGNFPLPGIDVRDVGRCVVSKYNHTFFFVSHIYCYSSIFFRHLVYANIDRILDNGTKQRNIKISENST